MLNLPWRTYQCDPQTPDIRADIISLSRCTWVYSFRLEHKEKSQSLITQTLKVQGGSNRWVGGWNASILLEESTCGVRLGATGSHHCIENKQEQSTKPNLTATSIKGKQSDSSHFPPWRLQSTCKPEAKNKEKRKKTGEVKKKNNYGVRLVSK